MLTEIIGYINEIGQGNQMVSGAIALAVSGTLGYILTRLPVIIARFIRNQFITTLNFNNSDWNKMQTFTKVSSFLSQLTTESGSRTLMLDSAYIDGKDITVLTIGYGKHFFFYRNRFMWLDRQKLESSGSNLLKEEITLCVFGRKHDIFKDLLNDNQPPNEDHLLPISCWDNGWFVKTKTRKTGLDGMALNSDVKKHFKESFEYFIDNEDVYRKLGLPYKMTLVLHGSPGTGKTSVIRAMASDYNMNICNLNLSVMSDKSFSDSLMTVPKNSIVVIEDFDSVGVTAQRKIEDENDTESISFLTLSGILNTLDGIASLDGVIIVMTTNYLQNIDSAILRSGRVDSIIELPEVSSEAVEGYFRKLYTLPENMSFPSLMGKDINKIVFEAKEDSKKAESLLRRFVEYEK